MSDHVTDLIQAIAAQDAQGVRAVYSPRARLVTMSPNTFQVVDGVDAVAEKLAEWFASWEENPAWSHLHVTREGNVAAIDFERTSTYEGKPWVVRQSHILELGADGIERHRIFCTGARAGGADLAQALAGVPS